jgi:hypothetical protein
MLLTIIEEKIVDIRANNEFPISTTNQLHDFRKISYPLRTSVSFFFFPSILLHSLLHMKYFIDAPSIHPSPFTGLAKSLGCHGVHLETGTSYPLGSFFLISVWIFFGGTGV